MTQLISVLSSIIVLFIHISSVMAGGTDGETVNTNNNTSNNTSNSSDSTTNTINPGIVNYPNTSAFTSTFSGYSSVGSQCGFSLSGAYTRDGNYQIIATIQSNPCANQRELETIRQEQESKREVVRANATIINTCINNRSQAVLKGINPDTICTLNQFQIPKNP